MPLTEIESNYLSMRRALIRERFSRLNDAQKDAVTATEGPILVLAGAGSGKTTVLINRIYNLVTYGRGSDSTVDSVPAELTYDDFEYLEAARDGRETDSARLTKLLSVEPCPAYRIMAITFTNKAAGELRERLARMLGDKAEDIWAATFHSACVRILRRTIDRIGYDKSFTIYDSDDSRRVMTAVCKDLNLDENRFKPRSVLEEIGRAKDMLIGPEDYARETGGDYRKEKISLAYTEYQRRLRSASALDFDDIIFKTVSLLEQDREVREYYQERFRYVLIDEYQDTNHAQNRLAQLLSGKYNNLCVVGDDDQSIYRFRGASVENILEFDRQYSDCRVFRLEQNYRSTHFILDAANHIIDHNFGRKGKTLWTGKNGGSPITVYAARDEQSEASYIAEHILEGKLKGGRFSDYTVLYRMNAQSNALEQTFSRLGVPYRIIGGLRFFDRAEIKDMLSYLCLIANHSDDLRLTRIINTPARGIGAKTVEAAAALSEQTGLPIFDILRSCESYPELSRGAAKLSAFCEMILRISDMMKEHLPSDVYEEVLSASGYRMSLLVKNDTESQGRLENIDELKSTIIEYEKRTDSPTLSGFLEEVSLFTDLDNYDPGEEAVTMMTVHSAKGLEFPAVFITGMEEGLFPSFRSLSTSEDTEEERRLAYVAVTRAKNELYITRAKRRMIFGGTQYNPVSRFINEIPDECMQSIEEEDFSAYGGGRSAFSSSPHGQRSGTGPERYFDELPLAPSVTQKSIRPTVSPAAPSGQGIFFTVGERINHKAFGEGTVTDVRPMGGDQLAEVEFTSGEKKKLMAKSACRFVTRL